MADGIDDGIVNEQTVRALLLRLVHRHVGAPKQLLGRRIGGIGNRNTNTGPNRDHPAIDLEAVADEADQPPAKITGDLYGARAGDHHGELVAADTGEQMATRSLAEAVRHGLEQAVAGRMAEGVVDLLEAIEIEINHGHRRAVDAARFGRLIQCRHQRRPVGKSAQLVIGGRVKGLRLAALDLAHAAKRDRDQEGHGQADQREHR